MAIAKAVFAKNASRKELFSKNSIVVELAPNTKPVAPTTPRYLAVFRFGSVVALNVSPRELEGLVKEIKKHAVQPILSGLERKENFGVLIAKELDNTSPFDSTLHGRMPLGTTAQNGLEPVNVVTGEYCIVPELDMNGVAVISNIMAQTVALDSYNDMVDDLLANFARINTTVTKTGSITATDKNFLFRIVAQNNSIVIDMISRVRLKDRSDISWSMTKLEKIHYGLKDEFEIDDRFDQIEFKLNLIHQNAKFFVEVLQHQKTNSLEWIIVVLIGLECILMCVDMSGMGEALFHRLF